MPIREVSFFVKVGREIHNLNEYEDEERIRIILKKIYEIDRAGNPVQMYAIKHTMLGMLRDEWDELRRMVEDVAKELGFVDLIKHYLIHRRTSPFKL